VELLKPIENPLVSKKSMLLVYIDPIQLFAVMEQTKKV